MPEVAAAAAGASGAAEVGGTADEGLAVPAGLRAEVADAFQRSVVEVLATKTALAAERCGAQTIVLGGGVMEQLHLFPRIRTRTQDALNGYIHAPEILERIDEFIVAPGLGNKAGVSGCIALGQQALAAST